MLLKIALIFLFLVLPTPVRSQAAGDAAAGQGLYFDHCAACHGIGGEGQGPLAQLLTVAPPDLTVLSARNGGVFPVWDVVRRIDGRDPLLAHGGEMPVFGPLFQGQDTAIRSESGQPILTSRAAVDLVAYLATLQP